MNPDITLPKPKFVTVYTALLTQSGTGIPTANVLQNTLGGTIQFTRTSTGIYTITSSGLFTANKTMVLIIPTLQVFNWAIASESVINLQTLFSGSPSDDMLENTPIEIRIYNI